MPSTALSEIFSEQGKKENCARGKKRGADAHVPHKSRQHRLPNEEDRKLEQGLEESMAGSDPPSITQPASDRPSESDRASVRK
jgi:hypothetical protein